MHSSLAGWVTNALLLTRQVDVVGIDARSRAFELATCSPACSWAFQRRHDPVVEAKRLARRIEALGFDVALTETAA